jgi:pyridoxine 5'-phosphate synthase PdxJ
MSLGLGINAGHDLDLHNLKYFAGSIPGLLEVSIGHALISDALVPRPGKYRSTVSKAIVKLKR